MDITKLIDANLGKRMMALMWAGWLIKEASDERQQIIIAVLAIAYMVCQTVSDWRKSE